MAMKGYFILPVTYWSLTVCSEFLNKVCTSVNKGMAEMNHVNWEPEGIVWAFRILYNDKRFAVTQRDSESSQGVDNKRRLRLHLRPSQMHPKAALIPASGWERILYRTCRQRRSNALNVCSQRGVNNSSPSPSSLSQSLSLSLFRDNNEERYIFINKTLYVSSLVYNIPRSSELKPHHKI